MIAPSCRILPVPPVTNWKVFGFTLIELMVTLAIVALLATIVLPVAELSVQRQREQELRMALREVRAAIDAYKQAGDEGRIVRPAGTSGYPKTLVVLEHGVQDARDPRGGKLFFLRKVPRDPLFPDASVAASDTWGLRSYASEADAPRAGEDVYDVYSLSEKMGMNGLPYRQW